ncbi:MAG: flagellar basal-body rod protein FlgF [Alphaproteobacteria bacterium]
MDNTRYIALSRQMGLWKQMDVVSNNMANMNTSGYKQDDVMFKSYIIKTEGAKEFGKLPVYFSQDFATYTNFSEGAMSSTGNALDLAIKGEGFFAVETDNGEKYTRKGNFSLDSDGKLVTDDGSVLLSENNEPFFIAPGEKQISISETGDVSTENGVIGKIKVVNFEDNNKLLKISGTMYENVSGNTMDVADEAVVAQGYIEKSNVNSIEEMTKMIKLQRSYEFVQQMIDQEHTRISNTIDMYSQLA